MDKREELSDTHKKKTATGPETHISLSLPNPKLMTKYSRGCYQNSSEVAKRVTWEQPQLLALHKTLPFFKNNFSLSLDLRVYAKETFLSDDRFVYYIFMPM